MFNKLAISCFVLVAFVTAHPSGYSKHEHDGAKYGHGDESAHNNNFHQKGEKAGHDYGDKYYSHDGKAAEHDAAAKNSGDHKHNKEMHHSDSGNKYADDKSNYNKDVKTKSFGFFDYKYVQPQYHMEQYHTDEKHAKKYAGDEHAAGQKHKDNSGYHADGHDGFKKAHEKHGDSQSEYGHEDDAHKKSYDENDGKYRDHADGYYDKGYNNYGHGQESQYYEPKYDYGYDKHHSAPYHGDNKYYGYEAPHY